MSQGESYGERRLKERQRSFAIRRDRLGRRLADLREAERAVKWVGLGPRPDFTREREFRFIDEYFARLGCAAVDGDHAPRTKQLVELACYALRAAGYRCARPNRQGRFTKRAVRKARQMMRDPRTEDALREKFAEVGLDGRFIANRLRRLIESEDEQAALKAIDIAIKVTGDYAPTKAQNFNANVGVRSNIFDGGATFLDKVGKPVTALPPAPDLTTFEQEMSNASTSPGREYVGEYRRDDSPE